MFRKVINIRHNKKVNSSKDCKEGRERKRSKDSLRLKETKGDRYRG